jgi:hypothetical protein
MLAHGVSDRELEDAFERFDAGQVVLVIDACNSGQALEAEEKRRGPMNTKGLAQLAYEKGIFILTAAQSFQAAKEVNRLGHGLLTHALVVQGLKGGEADAKPRDGQIVMGEWLDYATDRVPRMQVEEAKRNTRGLASALNAAQRQPADDGDHSRDGQPHDDEGALEGKTVAHRASPRTRSIRSDRWCSLAGRRCQPPRPPFRRPLPRNTPVAHHPSRLRSGE